MPKNPTQKDMNFGNTMFLCYLEPEKCQKSYPERHEFWQRHNSLLPEARELPNPTTKDTNFAQTALIDPSKNAKESIHFSRNSHIVLKCTHLTPSTLTKQQFGNT